MSAHRRALIGAVSVRRTRRNFYEAVYWPGLAQAMAALAVETPWEITCEFELTGTRTDTHWLAGNALGRGISIVPAQNIRFRFSDVDDLARNAIIWTAIPFGVRQTVVCGWDGDKGYLHIGALSNWTASLVLPAARQFSYGEPRSFFDGRLYRLTLQRTDTGAELWSAPTSQLME